MSKKSKNGRRGVSSITANPWLPPSTFSRDPRQFSFDLPDGRLSHPDPFRAPQAPRRSQARIKAYTKKVRSSYQAPAFYGFASPARVYRCVRRKIRTEVMHAKGYAGKRGQKRPVRNEFSDVRC